MGVSASGLTCNKLELHRHSYFFQYNQDLRVYRFAVHFSAGRMWGGAKNKVIHAPSIYADPFGCVLCTYIFYCVAVSICARAVRCSVQYRWIKRLVGLQAGPAKTLMKN